MRGIASGKANLLDTLFCGFGVTDLPCLSAWFEAMAPRGSGWAFGFRPVLDFGVIR
jgi:hypothetical protein